ncbi:prepilin-type N-terminal cleavage/methylation domain-containing protein [Phycisphaerales bacterium AB-hyl4]|uniref:Prepilin-type N-terminal cleavage/methylation domain-containing protein n=1 Tax=Natronomicrosphaera hydrolytica TaxID=3242702 RepID=A0ABV4U1J2_9BACT
MVSVLGTGDVRAGGAHGCDPWALWGAVRAGGGARGGFTLLELVMVLLVVGVLLGVSLPTLRPFVSGREVHAAAGEMVAMTRLARSLAVSEARVYRLHVDLELHELWLSHEELPEDEAVPVPVARPIVLPGDVAVYWEADDETLRRGYVRFYPNGRSDPGVFELVGRRGEPVLVAARSASERYAVREAAALGLGGVR